MDRISSLPKPKDLVCHLLSFLTTKQAARTSAVWPRGGAN
ncbi:unnamed protein product [Brassica oleracea var. botrytis]